MSGSPDQPVRADTQPPYMVEREQRARASERKIRFRYFLGIFLNLFGLALLALFAIVGIVLAWLASPENIPWLFSSKGLSLLAFLGASSVSFVRFIHKVLNVLPGDDNYIQAAYMDVGSAMKRKNRHTKVLYWTAGVPILVISFFLEAVSLMLG